jgi:hypothetical protein
VGALNRGPTSAISFLFLRLKISGYRGSFPGVKRPGRDVDHSPPFGAEVKNEWSYTSTPLLPLNAFTARTGKSIQVAKAVIFKASTI